MQRKVIILHETGSKSHYRALIEMGEQQGDITVVFREFSFIKLFCKGIINTDSNLIKKQFTNFFFLSSLIFSSGKTIIVGIAPYDWRVLLMNILLRNHSYYYHTSKTSWKFEDVSKTFFARARLVQKEWRCFINKSEGIFCVTEKAADSLIWKYKVNKISIVAHAIPNSYSIKPINQQKHDKLKCLFVGRFSKSKGIYELFKLIELLNESNFQFTFVGSGELENEIKSFCANKNNCKILGFVKNPELRNVYDNHDILLLPSLRSGPWEELFGIVIIEALSRGVLPITTDHTGPREILTNKLSNFIYKESEYVVNTKKALEDMYDNRDEMQHFKDIAYKRGRMFSSDKLFEKWASLLNFK